MGYEKYYKHVGVKDESGHYRTNGEEVDIGDWVLIAQYAGRGEYHYTTGIVSEIIFKDVESPNRVVKPLNEIVDDFEKEQF